MAQTGVGRPAIFGVAMSLAERQARYRNNRTPEKAKTQNKSRPGAAEKMKMYREMHPELKDGDAYMRGILGIKKESCPKELIEAKREQLLLKRALRELNKTLKEKNGN